MAAFLEFARTLFEFFFSTASESMGIIPSIFTWLVSDAVLPFFGIGIVVSLILAAVTIVTRVFWGR